MSVIERVRHDREDLARVLTKYAGIRRIVEDLHPDGSASEYRPLRRNRMVWRTTRVEPSLFSIKRLSFGHGLATPLAAAVVALSLVACSQSRESGSEGAGNEGSGEHGGMEGSGEHDGDGESSEGDGEESATQYGPGDTYDVVRAGARLVLRYDAGAQTFTGTVTNATNATLSRVRVEVHLSNGVELGPTTPVDLAPGQAVDIILAVAEGVRRGEHPPRRWRYRGAA